MEKVRKLVIKTKEEARAHLEASLGYIPERYREGVNKADWLNPAKSEAAERNYAEAVTKAASKKTRQAAITKMTNEEWRSAAVDKGANVIGERMRASLDKWSAAFNPIYDQVASKVTTLPARTTDWRQNVTKRLMPVVETWKKAAGKI